MSLVKIVILMLDRRQLSRPTGGRREARVMQGGDERDVCRTRKMWLFRSLWLACFLQMADDGGGGCASMEFNPVSVMVILVDLVIGALRRLFLRIAR